MYRWNQYETGGNMKFIVIDFGLPSKRHVDVRGKLTFYKRVSPKRKDGKEMKKTKIDENKPRTYGPHVRTSVCWGQPGSSRLRILSY